MVVELAVNGSAIGIAVKFTSKLLGNSPCVTLEVGIKIYVEWYQEYHR